MGNGASKSCNMNLHSENTCYQNAIKVFLSACRQGAIANIPNTIFDLLGKQPISDVVVSAARRGITVGTVYGLFSILLCFWSNFAPAQFFSVHSRPAWFILAYVAAIKGITFENFRGRSELAVFNAQQGIEVLYRMLMSRGYLPNSSYGPILLWTLLVTSLYRLKHYPKENLAGLLRLVVPLLYGSKIETSPTDEMALNVARKIGVITDDKDINYVIAGISKSLMFGILFGSLTSLIFALRQSKVSLGSIVTAILLSKITSNFIKYFTLLIAAPRAVDLFLLKSKLLTNDKVREIFAGISGGISGTLFLSSDITMFVGAKVVETIFLNLQSSGKIPKLPNYLVNHLYAASMALMFTGFAFEPHNLRPSTFTSLINYTGGVWKNLITSFSKIRSENGIPNPTEFQKWYEQVARPVITPIV